ncbi:MAG: phage late control D family protein [Deltaproteobacteria bacterium]|nr:phage late control D family protein [Deltaproteobacteria bacterium]
MVASPDRFLLSSFEILVNGTQVPVEVESHINIVMVDDNIDMPGMFLFELTDSDAQEGETPLIDDLDLFSLGNVVEVKMGYADELETLIIGEITGLEPEFVLDGLPVLTVRGYDRSHHLLRGRKTRTFVEQKDSEIVEKIASEAGLTAEVEDSEVLHPYVVQANQTDMAFLQDRAKRIQYEVVIEDKTLFFRPVSNAESEVVTLEMNDDLTEFYPRLSSVPQVSEVSIRGWDPKEKKEIVGQASIGDEVSTMDGQDSGAALTDAAFGVAIGAVTERPVMTQAEADQLAKAKFNNTVLSLIQGEGSCLGRTDLRSGKVIKIEGIGERFSGSYYIASVIHRYSPQDGYFSNFTVRRNAS